MMSDTKGLWGLDSGQSNSLLSLGWLESPLPGIGRLTQSNPPRTHAGNTLPKTNIDPDNGPLEAYFPLPTSGFQVPC